MSVPSRPPFLRVDDLDAARRFYVHVLGCRPADGRHPPLAGLGPDGGARAESAASREPLADGPTLALEIFGQPLTLGCRTDGERLPSADAPHAVFLLGVDDWCTLSERLRAHDLSPEIEPGRRFGTIPGEQCAMRLDDPDGNTLEFRGFAREENQLAA